MAEASAVICDKEDFRFDTSALAVVSSVSSWSCERWRSFCFLRVYVQEREKQTLMYYTQLKIVDTKICFPVDFARHTTNEQVSQSPLLLPEYLIMLCP